MRILVVYAHPVETSFVAALHAKTLAVLRAQGHEVDDCDLNAEGFDPVLNCAERLGYFDDTSNRSAVAPHVQRLLWAQALVLVYPVWNFGFPAILKGWFDRVFLPGVTFSMQGSRYVPTLRNIKHLTAIATYGSKRWQAWSMGDPPRKSVLRMLRLLVMPQARTRYLACYDMDNTTPERRAAFLRDVEQHFAAWKTA